MSEPWMGLHNPERHKPKAHPYSGEPMAVCSWCADPAMHCATCLPYEPCRCCLAAENEALRSDNDDLSAHLKVAWAQVQAVRELADKWDRAAWPSVQVVVNDLRRILDGGDA